MEDLILIALAGFLASFIDGALGMGFGATSSTLLLGAGLSPQSVSSTVNLAKVVTGLAAGISHWRFRNIHPGLVIRVGLAGCVGALIGVALLSYVSAQALKPLLAALLSLVGLRILSRFSKATPKASAGDAVSKETRAVDRDGLPVIDQRGVGIAGLLGGITNGLIGAWGPVVTPFLLHRSIPPRYAIGTANSSEVLVAMVSAVGLITSLGSAGFDLRIAGAMLVGGLLAAPLAAWVIRYIPARPMGIATAALLLFTNARELGNWAGLGSAQWILYASIGLLVALAGAAPKLRALRTPASA